MAKQSANGFVKVAWILEADVANPQFPTPAELNGNGLDLSAAISWEDYALNSTGSDDIEDRALTDLGNAVSRGSANYEAVLDFFRDKDNQDAASVYVDAFEAFRTSDVVGYLVSRVNEKPALDVFAAGDIVSVFKVIVSYSSDMTSGDNSTKFQVNFLSQGVLHTHTTVATASAVLGIPATATLAPAARLVLLPTLDGKSIRSRATYTSSDQTKATVSNQGVVVAVATGSVGITASYGASATPDTLTLTVS
jgi:hypothetical protein